MPNTKIGVRWQDRSNWRKKSGESTPRNGTKSQKKEKNGFKTVVVGGGGGGWRRGTLEQETLKSGGVRSIGLEPMV